MTQVIRSLDEISSNYDVLFCDLWGCLHNGVAVYPAAVAALRQFRQKGGKVVLLTNAPRPSQFVIRHLAKLGAPEDCWDVVVSSGDAAQEAMLQGAVGRKVWAIAPEKDNGFFDDIPAEYADAAPIRRVSLEEAEGIVCTGLFDEYTETPEDYRAQLTLAHEKGLPFLCANPDIIVDLGDQRLYCAGALAEFYDELGGTSLYFGKPHAPVYELARRRLGLGPDARILAIGDGIKTDILGAAQQNIDGLFVTGGLAHDQFGPDVEHPDASLLDPWLDAQNEAPKYSIGRLR